MRTITKNVYYYEELTEEAQAKALILVVDEEVEQIYARENPNVHTESVRPAKFYTRTESAINDAIEHGKNDGRNHLSQKKLEA